MFSCYETWRNEGKTDDEQLFLYKSDWKSGKAFCIKIDLHQYNTKQHWVNYFIYSVSTDLMGLF